MELVGIAMEDIKKGMVCEMIQNETGTLEIKRRAIVKDGD